MPSLILSWVMDCKDRQLTNAVTTYTSIYFSPVLIKAEVDHVRTHAVDDKLTDESLSIKVSTTNAGAVGMTSTTNEVIAAYSVDEHQLEIRIRIPSDWPLHRAEVKDVKRVGVDEDRWRAWVLGVQQTLWAHVSVIPCVRKRLNLQVGCRMGVLLTAWSCSRKTSHFTSRDKSNVPSVTRSLFSTLSLGCAPDILHSYKNYLRYG